MNNLIPILKLLAGVGLFLFAMFLLEDSLKNISGRRFKIFLKNSAKNNLTSILGGAAVTAILQSSSMVSLMVLAFVGAGVFTMKNALAIILGANLGTTIDSWVVATIGFKLNIEVIAYPAVFIGGLLLILLGKRKSVKYTSFFLIGFGLLFIALSFMKTAMEVQVKTFDFSQFQHMPLIIYLLIGFVITILVQSSSVTMALTLSALHADAITFIPAAVIVLGSETGTTIKILLSAIGGNASKKRVVLGNLLFNIFLTTFAFILLKPILYFITDILNITNPLIGLVSFSTLINLLSIIIFIPLLGTFAKFLERFFKTTDDSSAAYINQASVSEPQSALDLFKKETYYFMYNAMRLNLEQFGIEYSVIENQLEFETLNKKRNYNYKTLEEKYEFISNLQGELQLFYVDLRAKLYDDDLFELNQLISSVRSCMYSVKGIKDIVGDINNLSRSSKDIKYNYFLRHKAEIKILYTNLNKFLQTSSNATFQAFTNIYNGILNNYTLELNNFYKESKADTIDDIDITIALNFNRELFTSNKAVLMAVKDYFLTEKELVDFNKILVYKT